MNRWLIVACVIYLAIPESIQDEYPTNGIYLGTKEDRRIQYAKILEEFSAKQLEAVTDPNTVLKETILAYNNTMLVLLQTYSIVSTSAVTGIPKCDDPPKKESYKLVINARDTGIKCLETARDGILSVAGQAESIKELDIDERIKWLVPLDECLDDLKINGMKAMGKLTTDLIKCSVLTKP